MSLTRRSGRAERGRWSAIEWDGREIAVYDSAIGTLRLIEFFKDTDIDPLTKSALLPQLLLVDPDDADGIDFDAFAAYAMWELCGLDIDGSHEAESDGERAYDWEEDEQVIKASLYQAYGRSWEEISAEVSYRDLTAMMGMVPHETPLGQAIYYRIGTPPERDKYNGAEVDRWNRMAERWRLGGGDTKDRIEQANNRATDLFEALARSAKHV